MWLPNQDRWGRQRGGRKARWDKLDRQPSTLKSRHRAVGSTQEHLYDAFDYSSPVSKGSVKRTDGPEADSENLIQHLLSEDADSLGDRGFSSPSTGNPGQRTQAPTAAESLLGTKSILSTPGELGRVPRERKMKAVGALPQRGSGGSSVRGRRSTLRSPSVGTPLARSSSSLGDSGGSKARLGAFRGSPPPLHRRLSAPASAERGGGDSDGPGRGVKLSRKGRQRQQSGQTHEKESRVTVEESTTSQVEARAEERKQHTQSRPLQEEDEREERGPGSEAEQDGKVPPLPPSLSGSVFKNKLPSLTPRKAPPATPRYLQRGIFSGSGSVGFRSHASTIDPTEGNNARGSSSLLYSPSPYIMGQEFPLDSMRRPRSVGTSAEPSRSVVTAYHVVDVLPKSSFSRENHFSSLRVSILLHRAHGARCFPRNTSRGVW